MGVGVGLWSGRRGDESMTGLLGWRGWWKEREMVIEYAMRGLAERQKVVAKGEGVSLGYRGS